MIDRVCVIAIGLLIGLVATVHAFGDEIQTPNDSAIIQRQVDALPNGGTVTLENREYRIDAPIVLPSRVTLVGQGRGATVIIAPEGINAIETVNFAELSGSNKWLADEGVPYRFGIRDLTVRGGHHGIAIYGKGYDIRRVDVENAASDGFYSECANRSGQKDARDMPEATIDVLSVRKSGGAGIRIRGPHNMAIGNAISAYNDDWGFISEEVKDKFDGGIEACSNLHTYANGNDRGIYLGAVFAGNVIVDGDGLFVEHPACRLGSVKALNAGGEIPGITIATSNTQIGSLHVTMHRTSAGQCGLLIAGRRNVIGQALLSGNRFDNDGADIAGNWNRISSLKIERFNGTGLQVIGHYHDITADIVACGTAADVRVENSEVKIRQWPKDGGER